MRLKFFLRGLGIGIIVTTIMLTISHRANRTMSDSEIIERARTLGMSFGVTQPSSEETTEEESTTPAEETSGEGSTQESEEPQETTASGETASEKETTASAGKASEKETESPSQTASEKETATSSENTSEPETTMPAQTTDEQTTTAANEGNNAENVSTESSESSQEASGVVTYRLNIVRGASSNTVARELYENGIIDNAESFDEFLISGGYADRIRVGTFEVNSGMDYNDIAGAICGH